jgi:hypothetical protein
MVDKSTEIMNKSNHSGADDDYSSSLNSNLHHQQPSPPQAQQEKKDLRDDPAVFDQSQLTSKIDRELVSAPDASGHSRSCLVSSPSCYRFFSATPDTLNIGACALNPSNNNNNNNSNITNTNNHSPKLASSFDEGPTQDIDNSPGSPISFDSDTNSLISFYFGPLASDPDYDLSDSNHCLDMSLEVATQQLPPHALLTTPLSPAPSLTDTAFSSLVTRDSIYHQPFPAMAPAVNSGTADIFERSVQHQQQRQKQQDGSGVGDSIPLHFFNDDFIPAVLQASTEALTEPGLDPESIDVLSARRPSSLRSFSFSAVSLAAAPPLPSAISAASNETPAASLGPVAPASTSKQKSYESIISDAPPPQQQQSPRPRVLSFCSFADLVSSEQSEEFEPHNINNAINKQEIASPESLDSLITSRKDENDAGASLPCPPTRSSHYHWGAQSRRSSVFSATGDDDLEVASLRQVIRRNSAIMAIP